VLSELKPSIIFKERKIKLKSIVEKIKENPFLAMVLCCALPLIAIFAFSSLGILEILGKWGVYALILLCPLAHIWMMRGMFRAPEDSKVQQKIEEIEHK
jgi:hypothetical protein